MSAKHVYEYAVIRFLPQVEREEFINVGVILFCKQEKYIKVLYKVDEARIQAFAHKPDIAQLRHNLESFVKIAGGAKQCGPIAQLDLPSRFRWLTAVKSSSLQTSRPHPGICTDLEQTAQRLFEELVL